MTQPAYKNLVRFSPVLNLGPQVPVRASPDYRLKHSLPPRSSGRFMRVVELDSRFRLPEYLSAERSVAMHRTFRELEVGVEQRAAPASLAGLPNVESMSQVQFRRFLQGVRGKRSLFLAWLNEKYGRDCGKLEEYLPSPRERVSNSVAISADWLKFLLEHQQVELSSFDPAPSSSSLSSSSSSSTSPPKNTQISNLLSQQGYRSHSRTKPTCAERKWTAQFVAAQPHHSGGLAYTPPSITTASKRYTARLVGPYKVGVVGSFVGSSLQMASAMENEDSSALDSRLALAGAQTALVQVTHATVGGPEKNVNLELRHVTNAAAKQKRIVPGSAEYVAPLEVIAQPKKSSISSLYRFEDRSQDPFRAAKPPLLAQRKRVDHAAIANTLSDLMESLKASKPAEAKR